MHAVQFFLIAKMGVGSVGRKEAAAALLNVRLSVGA